MTTTATTERKRPDLREFQEEDLPWFLEHPKSFILYEPRLGKTVMSANIIALDTDLEAVLIVCPKNALFTWVEHVYLWCAKLCPQYSVDVRLVRHKGTGSGKETRQKIWLKPRTASLTVYVCTFGVLQQDYNFLMLPSVKKSGFRLDAIFGDEVHIRQKNRKTKTNAIFKNLVKHYDVKRYHALSGTMAGKGGPTDFWPILNIFDNRLFGSYWRFAGTFCEIIDNGWGKEIIGVRNLQAFWALLDRYSRRRFRKDIESQMPTVQRQMLSVEPTLEQLNMWNAIHSDGYYSSRKSDDMIFASTSLEMTLRKRQILACPRIFGPDFGIGASMEDLVERLQDPEITVTQDDKHIVIFTAFSAAIPHFEAYLKENGFGNVFKLHGGIEPEEQHERIRAFQRTKGIMICSIKYAQAFSLASSEQCFFIGYEYDPNENKQAEDRLVGQEGGGHIDSYYYSCIGLDNETIGSVDDKNKLISLTMGSADLSKVKL